MAREPTTTSSTSRGAWAPGPDSWGGNDGICPRSMHAAYNVVPARKVLLPK
jgi:hypothetical protein